MIQPPPTPEESAALEASRHAPPEEDVFTRRVSGRWVVLLMFGFAATMVGLMWLYWEAYTRPYRELQLAIAAEFPGSTPRVIGGRHKSGREGDPQTLRILVYISLDDFNPEEDQAQRDEVLQKLAALAGKHQDLSLYEMLEIRLMQRLPEEKWRRYDSAKSIQEWRENLEADAFDVSHWPSTTAKSELAPAGRVNSKSTDSVK